MGLGSAAGWLWERVHRSRRSPQPETGTNTGVAHVAAQPRPAASAAEPPIASRPTTPRTAPAVASGPKTLVIIFGPPAVGKMTVGDALARRTGLRLFHNHLTIDPVLRFFEFGTPAYSRLVSEFRTRIFEEVAASPLPGMIFTFVWGFNDDSDARYIERMSAIFRARGADVVLVELETTVAERLRRNETEFRLAAKETKRDLVRSRAQLIDLDTKHRLNSRDEFVGRSDYLRIENTDVSADDAAERIIQHFGLLRAPAMETV
jgi:hypothetical protein